MRTVTRPSLARLARLARRAARAICAIGCVGLPALAAPNDGTPGAPREQYKAFDRTSPEITDAKTQLIWERAVNRAATLTAMTDACTGVGRRLPNVKELLTLVDEFPADAYENGAYVKKAIDRVAFDGGQFSTPTDLPYWTSTPAGAGRNWVVDFSTGEVTTRENVTAKAHARCVR